MLNYIYTSAFQIKTYFYEIMVIMAKCKIQPRYFQNNYIQIAQ